MKSLRPLVALFGLLSLAALSRAESVPPTPAPAWSLKDVDGHDVSSEQFKGKVLVVDFWATWCGPCRTEIPGYVALQKKYGKERLAVIGISLDQGQQGPGLVKKFIEKNKVDYQIVMADEAVVAAFGGTEGIQYIPTTFIIDRSGQIRDRKSGAEHTDEFEKRLVKILE